MSWKAPVPPPTPPTRCWLQSLSKHGVGPVTFNVELKLARWLNNDLMDFVDQFTLHFYSIAVQIVWQRTQYLFSYGFCLFAFAVFHQQIAKFDVSCLLWWHCHPVAWQTHIPCNDYGAELYPQPDETFCCVSEMPLFGSSWQTDTIATSANCPGWLTMLIFWCYRCVTFGLSVDSSFSECLLQTLGYSWHQSCDAMSSQSHDLPLQLPGRLWAPSGGLAAGGKTIRMKSPLLSRHHR